MMEAVAALRDREPCDAVLVLGEEWEPVHASYVALLSPYLRTLFSYSGCEVGDGGKRVYRLSVVEPWCRGGVLRVVVDMMYGGRVARGCGSGAGVEMALCLCEAAVLADAMCVETVARDLCREACACVRAEGGELGAHVVLARLSCGGRGEALGALWECSLGAVVRDVAWNPEVSLWAYLPAERGGPLEGRDDEALVMLSRCSGEHKSWVLRSARVPLECAVKAGAALGEAVDDDVLRQLSCEEVMRCWKAGVLDEAQLRSLGASGLRQRAPGHACGLVMPLSFPGPFRDAAVGGVVSVVERGESYVLYYGRTGSRGEVGIDVRSTGAAFRAEAEFTSVSVVLVSIESTLPLSWSVVVRAEGMGRGEASSQRWEHGMERMTLTTRDLRGTMRPVQALALSVRSKP